MVPTARQNVWEQFISCEQSDLDDRQFIVYCRLCRELHAQNLIAQVPEKQRWNIARSRSQNTTRFNQHCKLYHSDNLAVIEVYALRDLTRNEREQRFQNQIIQAHPIIERVQFPHNPATRHEFIRSVIMFICMSGSSFSIISNTYFRAMFSCFAENVPILGRNIVAGKELGVLYAEIRQDAQLALSAYIASGGKLKLQLDGWAGPRRKKYVNIIIKTDTRYFYWATKVISSDMDEHETGRTVSQFVNEVVNHFGETNVIAFGTDNASNMRNTWELVAQQYSNTEIYFYSCTAHALNIYAKLVIASSRFFSVFKAVKSMLLLMNNNDFLEYYLDLFGRPFGRAIPTFIETRWCSTYTTVKFIYDHYNVCKTYAEFCGISSILFEDRNTLSTLHALCECLKEIKQEIRRLEEDKSFIGDAYVPF